jgi:phosphoribosyl 1,2-cyclic phosphodiesterase
MKLWMLGSGSGGNAVLVDCEGERILIDAGFGPRTIGGRLRAAGVAPESIAACFVTHEHGDHIGGLARASAKWGWPMFATRGTLDGEELGGLTVLPVTAGEEVALSRLRVQTVPMPHDAREPVGFVVTEQSTGARASIFYDLGHASRAVREACANADILVIESNYDDHMLANGPYPPFLQKRVASNVGHLSNRVAADVAARSVCRNLNHIVLAHISENCNTPGLALRAVSSRLKQTPFRGRLTVSSQDKVVGPFEPKSGRAAAPTQLDLGF